MDTNQSTRITEVNTTLDLSNRCDFCPAHANVTAVKGEQVLMFCRHHYHVCERALAVWAETIILFAVPA